MPTQRDVPQPPLLPRMPSHLGSAELVKWEAIYRRRATRELAASVRAGFDDRVCDALKTGGLD